MKWEGVPRRAKRARRREGANKGAAASYTSPRLERWAPHPHSPTRLWLAQMALRRANQKRPRTAHCRVLQQTAVRRRSASSPLTAGDEVTCTLRRLSCVFLRVDCTSNCYSRAGARRAAHRAGGPNSIVLRARFVISPSASSSARRDGRRRESCWTCFYTQP